MWKFWKKKSAAVELEDLVRRYWEAHDDLADDVFTIKGAAIALAKEEFKEDGMGNYFCQINYQCRKDREPLIFKITQREYAALQR